MKSIFLYGCGLLIALSLSGNVAVSAADNEEIQRELLDKLNQPVRNFDFFEAPLTDVVNRIKDDHELPILLDLAALADEAIGSDTLVTISLRGVSLESGLNIMLRDHGLIWTVSDEVLIITPQSAAARHMQARVYPVRDLVLTEDGKLAFDELTELLTKTIAPDSWEESPVEGKAPQKRGGVIAVSNAAGALVIRQLPQTHAKIEEMLFELRQTRKIQEQGDNERQRTAVKP